MTNKKNKIKKLSLKLKPPQKDRLKSKPKKPDPFEKTNLKETIDTEKLSSPDHQKPSTSLESEKQSDSDSLSLNSQIQKEDSDLSLQPDMESPSKETKPKEESYEEKIQALEKSLLYLKADFENYKKRTAKEKADLFRYGGEEFILALANEVLDDLDRAYENFNNTKSLESFKSGIDLIYKNLQKILNRFHIEASDPKGKPFDPRYHEALSRQPTDKIPKDHVLTTFRKAYTLHKKLIRPAQVVVTATEKDTSS